MFLIGSALPSTSISHSLALQFIPGVNNLVLAKNNKLELYSASTNLSLILTIPIFGRIVTLAKLIINNKAYIVLTTDKSKICILAWDTQLNNIVTEAFGHISDHGARPVECGQILLVNENSIMVYMSQGLLKIIPLSLKKSKLQLGQAFNVRFHSLIRMDKLQVIGMTSLNSRSVFCVLHQGVGSERYLTNYSTSTSTKEISEGVTIQVDRESLLAIPSLNETIIVVSESQISIYAHTSQLINTVAIKPTIIKTLCQIDTTRYLLADHLGLLYILAIHDDFKLHCSVIGVTTQASCLSYLDNGLLFIGSHLGDSQLIHLSPPSTFIKDIDSLSGTKASDMIKDTEIISDNNCITIIETMINLAPITDFCLVSERESQSQVVTCSGLNKDASLRLIKNGININDLASLPNLQGLQDIFALHHPTSKTHHLILYSFESSSRLHSIVNDELIEFGSGFLLEERSVHVVCFGDCILQITPKCINVIDVESMESIDRIVVDREIVAASSCNSISTSVSTFDSKSTSTSTCNGTVVIATTDGYLQCYEVVGKSVKKRNSMANEDEISCLYISSSTNTCIVGFWGSQYLKLINLDTFVMQSTLLIPGDFYPRYILQTILSSEAYLMVTVGNGTLYYYKLQDGQLSDVRSISLGSGLVKLIEFNTDPSFIFALSDSPTVLHLKSGRLECSSVNQRSITAITPLSTLSSPKSLMMYANNTLSIGTIESVQKLHVKSIEVGETYRRIVNHNTSGKYCVITTSFKILEDGVMAESSSVKLLDPNSFAVVDVYPLKECEIGQSVYSIVFKDDGKEYLIVGTGFAFQHEDESTIGRVLVFAVGDTLTLVNETEVGGCVYSIAGIHGRLVVAVNSKVILMSWDIVASALLVECTHHGHLLALTLAVHGDFIIVGDLMKSITCLVYDAMTKSIKDRARDYDSNWMTAVEAISDELYIGADDKYNLFVCRKINDLDLEVSKRLEVVGAYHLGEMINQFKRGSLVAVDDTMIAKTILLFCTVNGGIGVIATLDDEHFELLSELERVIGLLPHPGNLSHTEWREFKNERKKRDAFGFIDADLVECFLMMRAEQQASIVSSMKVECTADHLVAVLENIKKIH